MTGIAERLRAVALGDRPPWQYSDEPSWATSLVSSDARHIHRDHEAELIAKGWTIAEIYGAHDRCAWGRIDRQGLAWSLHDRKIAAIFEDRVVLDTPHGQLVYRKPQR